jgi:hypothetical protein
VIGRRARTVVIGVVVTVWAANFVAGVFVKGYEPDQGINGVALAVIGGLFALGKKDQNSNDSGNNSGGSGGEGSS